MKINYVKHVKYIENDYWESDGLIDRNFENIVINLLEYESDTDDEEMSFSDILKENNYNINKLDHNYIKNLF